MWVKDGELRDVSDKDIKDGQFVFPEGVTSIGSAAFQGCSNLVSITIPKGVTTIKQWAFSSCDHLVSINIAEGVTTIENNAFRSCVRLASISTPKSLISIGEDAFLKCLSISAMHIEAETRENYEKILSSLPDNVQRIIQNKHIFFIAAVTNLLALDNRNQVFLQHKAMQNEIIHQQLFWLAKQYGIPSFMRDEVFEQFGIAPKMASDVKKQFVFGKMNFFQEQPYVNEDIKSCKQQLDALRQNIEEQIIPDLDEANECLDSLLLLEQNFRDNMTAFIEKGADLEFAISLSDSLKKLKEIIAITKRLNNINKEMEEINSGAYQLATTTKSYGFKDKCEAQNSLMKSWALGEQTVYPLIYESGLRATIATPIKADTDPVEIEINFLGTVDFASKVVDMDEGGPGQVALKEHETKLLEQVNHVMEQMAEKYPDKTFRLRISGHSLGGALAKGFAHTMQRACAVLQEKPDKIIGQIKKEWEINEHNPDVALDDLKAQLEADAAKFNNFKALNKISGITVYALGAPGVSETTDKHGTLLTYYHNPDFLRLYRHQHKDDIMVKFGDTEFLSGTNGVPRMLVNKAITYDIKITPEDEERAGTLPFPNITKHVMAAHNKSIKYSKVEGVETIELEYSTEILGKFVFLPIQRFFYDLLFSFAKFAATFESMVTLFPDLRSLPVYNVDKPAMG